MPQVEQLDWSKLQPPQKPVIAPQERKKPITPEFQEYEVKVKDRRQNTTQVLHQWARNSTEANEKVLQYLCKSFRHTEFEIM